MGIGHWATHRYVVDAARCTMQDSLLSDVMGRVRVATHEPTTLRTYVTDGWCFYLSVRFGHVRSIHMIAFASFLREGDGRDGRRYLGYANGAIGSFIFFFAFFFVFGAGPAGQ